MKTIKHKAAKALSRKQNAENLATLLMLSIIEVAVSVELRYWMLAIVITISILAREASVIIMLAEEVEDEVEEAIERVTHPVPVPIENEENRP